jgi:protein-L-isoaspartate(D-aspartate) O-methyltransferase
MEDGDRPRAASEAVDRASEAVDPASEAVDRASERVDPASEAVDRAFAAVHRADFLPPDLRRAADADQALQIGYGQTNSQPTTVRDMLHLLEVQPGDRVLDVGCGSGWTTALLGVLVGPTGCVDGVEIIPELVAWGRENLAGYALPWAHIHQSADGVLGLPEHAPYDRILVSEESRDLPTALTEQLAPSGRMVVPVAGRMHVVRRTDSRTEVERHGYYSFVPLIT